MTCIRYLKIKLKNKNCDWRWSISIVPTNFCIFLQNDLIGIVLIPFHSTCNSSKKKRRNLKINSMTDKNSSHDAMSDMRSLKKECFGIVIEKKKKLIFFLFLSFFRSFANLKWFGLHRRMKIIEDEQREWRKRDKTMFNQPFRITTTTKRTCLFSYLMRQQ